MATCQNYNLIYDITDISGDSGDTVEPVTVEEVKNYIRLQGWEESGDFDFDDTLIEMFIRSARVMLEKYTQSYLVPRTLQVTFANGVGMIELPGPVSDTIVFRDDEGDVISEVTTVGSVFPKVKTPHREMTAVYEAGYTTVPDGLKIAIMAEVAYRYEHRGDETNLSGLSKDSRVLAMPYKRGSAWA